MGLPIFCLLSSSNYQNLFLLVSCYIGLIKWFRSGIHAKKTITTKRKETFIIVKKPLQQWSRIILLQLHFSSKKTVSLNTDYWLSGLHKAKNIPKTCIFAMKLMMLTSCTYNRNSIKISVYNTMHNAKSVVHDTHFTITSRVWLFTISLGSLLKAYDIKYWSAVKNLDSIASVAPQVFA